MSSSKSSGLQKTPSRSTSSISSSSSSSRAPSSSASSSLSSPNNTNKNDNNSPKSNVSLYPTTPVILNILKLSTSTASSPSSSSSSSAFSSLPPCCFPHPILNVSPFLCNSHPKLYSTGSYVIVTPLPLSSSSSSLLSSPPLCPPFICQLFPLSTLSPHDTKLQIFGDTHRESIISQLGMIKIEKLQRKKCHVAVDVEVRRIGNTKGMGLGDKENENIEEKKDDKLKERANRSLIKSFSSLSSSLSPSSSPSPSQSPLPPPLTVTPLSLSLLRGIEAFLRHSLRSHVFMNENRILMKMFQNIFLYEIKITKAIQNHKTEKIKSNAEGKGVDGEGAKDYRHEVFMITPDTFINIKDFSAVENEFHTIFPTPSPSSSSSSSSNESKSFSASSSSTSASPSKIPSTPSSSPPFSSPIDFSSVGGLHRELSLIRDIVEFPLHYSHIFAQYKVRPPHGILLYGPPGTGKSLIAHSIATSCRCSFYSITSSEILSKYVGESESKLIRLFDRARSSSPSIIFIDEIDTIAKKRTDSYDELSKRLVGTLLTLMDGLQSSDHIIVIGATNRVDSIDLALRRAGRFDKEIEIGIPNQQGRKDILSKILAKMPHSLQENELEYISSVTHGYVGADLQSLCAEAATIAVQRTQEEKQRHESITSSSSSSPPPSSPLSSPTSSLLSMLSSSTPPPFSSVSLTLSDLNSSLPFVRPSAMRELLVEIPKTQWSDIGGQGDVKRRLQEAIEWPLLHPEAFVSLGISPPKGILLYGPPGCSKTLMAKALSHESKRNFIAVKGPEIFNKYVGESEKSIREIFQKARAAAPSIVFFDEMDSISVRRSTDGSGDRVAERVLSQLLIELDGIDILQNVIILAATNRPDIIDDALIRPGRIDRLMYVRPPRDEEIADILLIEMKKMKCNGEVKERIGELSFHCKGFSGAEISAMCREAGMICLEEKGNATEIMFAHFEKAAKNIKPQITKEMLEFYEHYAETSTITSI